MRQRAVAFAFGLAPRGPLALVAACGLAAPAAAQLTEPFPAVFELEILRASAGGDGSLGFVLHGHEDDDLAGWSVAAAGDINGDGMDDLVVGAPGRYYYRHYYGPYSMTGRTYILFGRDSSGTGFAPEFDLFSLDGVHGFRFDGPALHTPQTGYSVAGPGDINGDGVDDLVLSTPGIGDIYVVFGRSAGGGGFPEPLTPEDLHGEGGFTLRGDPASGSGFSVAAGGDVNGDGLRDIIVGAPEHGSARQGAAHVVFGRSRAAPFPGVVALEALSAAEGFTLRGLSAGDRAGHTVAPAGDVNGDGKTDIVIGAPGADAAEPDAGSSYIVFGRTEGAFPASLAELDGVRGFRIDGDGEQSASGVAVASAGDVNGDGADDLIISALGEPGFGRAFVVFGRSGASGFPPVLRLGDLQSEFGFRIEGVPGGAPAVASAGDVNGDGVDDIVLGALQASPGGRAQAGQSFVIFGRAASSPFPPVIDVAELDGAAGFRINGIEPGSSSGHAVASAGDLNGDGAGDLVIGAPHWYMFAPGEAYVIFGRAPGPHCYADCDGSGGLDFFDFLCFQNRFAAGDPQADCDESGELDFFDFLCFQNAFAAGCP